jgi:hypothetical protein
MLAIVVDWFSMGSLHQVIAWEADSMRGPAAVDR